MIPWGNAFNILAFICSGFVFRRLAKKSEARHHDLVLIGLVGAFFGLLVAHWVECFSEAQWHAVPMSDLLNVSVGGRSILGGLVGGWIAVELAKKRFGICESTGLPFAFALPVAEAIGRIACYFDGCCYGKPSTVAWAIYQHGAWRQPTQLYSLVAALATVGVLVWLRKRVTEGQLFPAYIAMFAAFRMMIEPERADFGNGSTAVLALVTCLGLFCAGLILYRQRGLASSRVLR